MVKILLGTVVSSSSDKTIVVKIDRRKTHPIYKKQYTVSSKIQAHDPENLANFGDKVSIQEITPVSKNKRWQIKDVLKKYETVEGEQA